MTKVEELIPGDYVDAPDLQSSGTFIVQTPHPRYDGLQLVVWRLEDGSWSFDALHRHQDVGHVRPAGPLGRLNRLDLALDAKQRPWAWERDQ